MLIPKEVEDYERIVRFLISPLHIKKNSNTIKSNLFYPTPNTACISVTRLEYKNADACKVLAKKMVKAKPGKEYIGFALHTKLSAIKSGAKDVLYEPTIENEAHAEIELNFIRPATNEAIPAEMQYVINKLKDNAIIFVDPNPSSRLWEGEDLQYHEYL